MSFILLKGIIYINLENVEKVIFSGNDLSGHIATIYFSSGKVEEYSELLTDEIRHLKESLADYGVQS